MPRKATTWPRASIHTPGSLSRQARHLDRQNNSAAKVIADMRRGASLHRSYSPRPHWRLSNGIWVTDEIALTVIADPSVTAVGDALFAGVQSQTYRFIKN